jgi:hypothetical protein
MVKDRKATCEGGKGPNQGKAVDSEIGKPLRLGLRDLSAPPTQHTGSDPS